MYERYFRTRLHNSKRLQQLLGIAGRSRSSIFLTLTSIRADIGSVQSERDLLYFRYFAVRQTITHLASYDM